MKQIKCAGAIFIDDEDKVLLEDRREISKHGEEWSFFGGTIEEGESIEEALKREIKEDLDYNLQDYEFFTEYNFQVDDLDLTYHIFLGKMPDLGELQPHVGAGLRKFPISEALDLKITDADKAILRRLEKHLMGEILLIVRPPTVGEEFEYLRSVLRKTAFYQEKGYSFDIPQHPVFQRIAGDPELVEETPTEKLKNIFTAEVYDPDFYQPAIEKTNQEREKIAQVFPIFLKFQKEWGFKVFPTYEVLLTRYGPGGGFNAQTGRIIMLTREGGKFKFRTSPTPTIVHEMVHIGVDDYVKKYNLNHGEKERLVDRICQLSFSDILPNYQPHRSGDRRLDEFVTEDALDNVPTALEDYVQKHHQN